MTRRVAIGSGFGLRIDGCFAGLVFAAREELPQRVVHLGGAGFLLVGQGAYVPVLPQGGAPEVAVVHDLGVAQEAGQGGGEVEQLLAHVAVGIVGVEFGPVDAGIVEDRLFLCQLPHFLHQQLVLLVDGAVGAALVVAEVDGKRTHDVDDVFEHRVDLLVHGRVHVHGHEIVEGHDKRFKMNKGVVPQLHQFTCQKCVRYGLTQHK